MPLGHITAQAISYQIWQSLQAYTTSNLLDMAYSDDHETPEPQEFVSHWVLDMIVAAEGDPETFEAEIATRLKATTAITDLVPDRSIYLSVIDGLTPGFPYVTWGKVSNLSVEHTMGRGLKPTIFAQYRFDCFAETR